MANSQQKGKKGSKKEEPLFTQEQRNSIPFVRAVSNKIRNICKKLSQIKQLEVKSQEQLKPQQKDKILKKQSLQEEQSKYQDLLKMFKQIESQRKQSQLSEEARIISQVVVLRQIRNRHQELIAKGIMTKNEYKNIKTNFKGQWANLNQQINWLNSLLKSKPIQITELTQRIASDSKFLQLQPFKQSKQSKQASLPSKQSKSTPVQAQNQPKTQEIVVQVCRAEQSTQPKPNQLLQLSQPLPSHSPQDQPVLNSVGAAQKSIQKNPSQLRSIIRKMSDYRRKGGQARYQEVTEDGTKFTKDEKNQLSQEGFTVVDKTPKVSSKYGTKQFGPRKDKRQYHQ